MRIVGGKHRGRRLEAPPGQDIRPTADRVREALFNVLAHRSWGPNDEFELAGARVLDAFCGTGAFGLEALSRGAAHATFLDLGRSAIDCTKRNIEVMGESDAAKILRADATKPPPAKAPCTLAFLDPPYKEDLAGAALAALSAQGWFAPGALVILEAAAAAASVPDVPSLTVIEERRYGKTLLVILEAG
ncbi:MAG: 16S rRNA (guanine(966)-N(2))-methyltransferase RsmD [Azospirillum sp.]|nr:16S rRNA (guanine(966)-N(2))-methyltransferase RsmD [Azospirillum sp.]